MPRPGPGNDFPLRRPAACVLLLVSPNKAVRDEYIRKAQQVIPDPNILINVVSRRVKQLKYGQRPLVESLERLSPEDIALREIIEGKITYELYEPEKEQVSP